MQLSQNMATHFCMHKVTFNLEMHPMLRLNISICPLFNSQLYTWDAPHILLKWLWKALRGIGVPEWLIMVREGM